MSWRLGRRGAGPAVFSDVIHARWRRGCAVAAVPPPPAAPRRLSRVCLPLSPASSSSLSMAWRGASTTTAHGGGGGVDDIVRPMGYGPFSATAKARHARDHAAQHPPLAADASTTVMQNVGLDTNLHLRLSLAGLPHPSQLAEWAYTSPQWRLAFVRLYRTILRLHNKTVAVSLRTSRGQGPEAAVAAVTRVRTSTAADAAAAPDADAEDHLLRYLLTPDQQEFGNRFVQGEFGRHLDADAVSATTFYASWYDYVLQLASGVTARELTEQERRLLSDEQKEKLNSLRGAFRNLRASQQPNYMP